MFTETRGAISVAGTHSYATPGSFTVKVSVTNQTGGSSVGIGVADVVPPTAVAGVVVQGPRVRPNRLVITFTEPLDPGSAQFLPNDTRVRLRRGGRFPTNTLASILYDPTARTATLTPFRALHAGATYRLTINGTTGLIRSRT